MKVTIIQLAMNFLYNVKFKLKAASLIFIIITLVLAAQLWERYRYEKLQKSVTTIYNDRLLPASYIFELTDLLYKNHIFKLKDQKQTNAYRENKREIDSIINLYEKTYLTKEEVDYWKAFKTNLNNYTLNTDSLRSYSSFEIVIKDLHNLNEIQLKEGNLEHKQSKSIIEGSLLSSNFVLVLLITLGLIAVILLGISDRAIYKNAIKGREQLN